MDEPTHLDLFSGIGGFALAARLTGFKTVAFVEIDKYCQRVIIKNFGAKLEVAGTKDERPTISGSEPTIYAQKLLGDTDQRQQHHDGEHCSDEARGGSIATRREMDTGNASRRPSLFGDIFRFDGTKYRGVDLLTGGFPCQPFSVAGNRRGADDDRSLWPQMFRVIKESAPTLILAENVPGIIQMELDNVLSDLEAIGYATTTYLVPACAVDAPHRRMRVWIVGVRGGTCDPALRQRLLGVAGDEGLQGELPARSGGEKGREIETGHSPDASGLFCRWRPEQDWFSESGMGRVAHGIPNRVDRLRGLGNAIVPAVAAEILRELRKLL